MLTQDIPLQKIYFHGTLGETYGKDCIEIYAQTIQLVFSGLTARFGNTFRKLIIDNNWYIISGQKKEEELLESDKFFSEEEVSLCLPSTELHVYPAISGSGAVGRIIVGVVLVIVGIVLAVGSFGVLSAFGVPLIITGISFIAGGVIELLTPTPKVGNYGGLQQTDRKESFLYNGAVNNVEQGVPVPRIYGTFTCGSTIINGRIVVKQVSTSSGSIVSP